MMDCADCKGFGEYEGKCDRKIYKHDITPTSLCKRCNDLRKRHSDIPYLERTKYPYTLRYPTEFEESYREEDVVKFVTVKMFYENRYIRLSVNPILIEDDIELAKNIMLGALERITTGEK